MGKFEPCDPTTTAGMAPEKDAEEVALAWSACLERLRPAVKSQDFAICLGRSQARMAEPGQLEIMVGTRFALTRVQEAGLQEKVHAAVAAVIGEGWSVTWSSDEPAGACAEESAEEPMSRPRARRPREERPRRTRSTSWRAEEDATPSAEGLAHDAQSAHFRRFNFDNFVVGSSNQMATQAARRVAEQPGSAYNPLLIYGDKGLGKTHLMVAVRNRMVEKNPEAKVACVSAETFTNDWLESIHDRKGGGAAFRRKYRSVDCLLVDDVEFLVGKERTQVEFHNTFDDLVRRGCQIILTCDRPPRLLYELQERLCSRLSSGLIADIQKPCVDMCVEIVRQRARNSGAGPITEDALRFIAEHFGSDVRSLEGALVKVLFVADARGQHLVDLDLARCALECLQAGARPAPAVTISVILDRVSHYYHINVSDLTGKRRDRRYSSPRHVAMFLAHRLASMGCRQIGEAFGGKDYSSVQHALHKVEGMQKEPAMGHDLRSLASLLGANLE